jgi:serine/threonine-protein kinase HipA
LPWALIARGNPRGELVYGRNYLARTDAVPIDPIELKLAPATYQTLNLKGVFGALRDARVSRLETTVEQR